jgi:cell division protein FtsB
MSDYANVLFGNLAYNSAGTAAPDIVFPREDKSRTTEAEPAAQPRPEEERRVRVSTRNKPKVSQPLPLFAIFGTIIVAFSMFLLLRSRVTLTALSNEAALLEQKIAALEEEKTKLEIKYESAFNLEQVEAYAMAELGMVKAGNEQIAYINNTLDDKAVILSENGASLTSRIKAFVMNIIAYLK